MWHLNRDCRASVMLHLYRDCRVSVMWHLYRDCRVSVMWHLYRDCRVSLMWHLYRDCRVSVMWHLYRDCRVSVMWHLYRDCRVSVMWHLYRDCRGSVMWHPYKDYSVSLMWHLYRVCRDICNRIQNERQIVDISAKTVFAVLVARLGIGHPILEGPDCRYLHQVWLCSLRQSDGMISFIHPFTGKSASHLGKLLSCHLKLQSIKMISPFIDGLRNSWDLTIWHLVSLND